MGKEWNFSKLNHDIKVIVEEKEDGKGYTITMETAGITAGVNVARHPKYGWYYIVSDPEMYKELGFPKKLNMLHGTAQEVFDFGKEIEKHQAKERNMSLDQKIEAIKTGKEDIKTYRYSGSILDGNIPENEESEAILRELGLCHDVEGWGVRIEEQLIWKLGSEFSYEDLMKATTEKRAKDAAKKAAKQEKETQEKAKKEAAFAEAKKTGKPQEIARWNEEVEGDDENSLDICIQFAMPDGTTSVTRNPTF